MALEGDRIRDSCVLVIIKVLIGFAGCFMTRMADLKCPLLANKLLSQS